MEATISFGEVGGNRQRRAVQLVDQKIIATRKGFGLGGTSIRKIHSLLIDLKVLEHESHLRDPGADQENS